jgi:hypothetical protein
MSSKLELLEQCIADLEADKNELKGEIAELKNENARLLRRMPGVMLRMPNTRSESRNWRKIVQIFQQRMLSLKLN